MAKKEWFGWMDGIINLPVVGLAVGVRNEGVKLVLPVKTVMGDENVNKKCKV